MAVTAHPRRAARCMASAGRRTRLSVVAVAMVVTGRFADRAGRSVLCGRRPDSRWPVASSRPRRFPGRRREDEGRHQRSMFCSPALQLRKAIPDDGDHRSATPVSWTRDRSSTSTRQITDGAVDVRRPASRRSSHRRGLASACWNRLSSSSRATTPGAHGARQRRWTCRPH